MAWVHSLLGGLSCSRWRKCAASGSLSASVCDALAVARVVMPVKKHRGLRGQQRIGDVARAGFVVIFGLRPQAAQHGDAGAQHVHGVRVRGKLLEGMLHFGGQTAQAEQALLVCGQLRGGGQLAVDEQVRHFGKFAVLGQVGDVVAAIVQVVAALADGADGGIARGRARQRDGFLGFEGGRRVARLLNAHVNPRESTKLMDESKECLLGFLAFGEQLVELLFVGVVIEDICRVRRGFASAAARFFACPQCGWLRRP